MSRITTEEFKYFAINTPGKWHEGRSDSTLVDQEGNLSLAPLQTITQFSDIGYATGLAFDHKGDLYIIDALNCHIFKYGRRHQTLERLLSFCPGFKITAASLEKLSLRDVPDTVLKRLELLKDQIFLEKKKFSELLTCLLGNRQRACYEALILEHACLENCGPKPGQFTFRPPLLKDYAGGLAFGNSTLYVADTYNHRIQAFYLPNFQIRFVLGKEDKCLPVPGDGEAQFHTPKDIVVDRRGNFYVLDQGNKRIQKFNHRGKFLAAFGHQNGTLQNPENLAIDHEETLYVVDSGTSTVEKFNTAGEYLGAVIDFDSLGFAVRPSGVAVDGEGLIYVGERRISGMTRELSIYQFDKTGRLLSQFSRYKTGCFDLALGGSFGKERPNHLVASCDSEVFSFDGGQEFERQGVYYSRVFDSTIERARWHRLTLTTKTAEKAGLTVYFHAADEPVERIEIDDNNGWQYLFTTSQNSREALDALFSNAVGRFLQLKFEFFGDGQHTYRVKETQVYFERLSYLRYLPATYQEDEAGRDFLERFLSVFETMNQEIEREIDGIARYFDPEVVEGEFLDWLETWLAITRDDNWPETKRKNLLEQAFRLYQKRGTLEGLQEIITLFTGSRTRIIEHYRLKAPLVIGANSHLGRSTVVGKKFPTTLLLEETSRIGEFALKDAEDPPEAPFEEGVFDFTIMADTSSLENEEQVNALRRLVDAEKPAYTRCFLKTGQNAALQLGVHTLLELDTRLSKGFPPLRLGATSCIGKNTFLGTNYCRKGTIGMRSTVAVDTILH